MKQLAAVIFELSLNRDQFSIIFPPRMQPFVLRLFGRTSAVSYDLVFKVCRPYLFLIVLTKSKALTVDGKQDEICETNIEKSK